MKKFLIAALAVIIAAVLCAPAYADVINSNHYIEEPDGYPKFNSDESEWEVLGWTVVDTEIVRLGYMIDGEDPVWVVDDIDIRDNNSVIKRNDCFEDLELEAAIKQYNLANKLNGSEFFAYRIHVTLDTTTMEKGTHDFEVIVEYENGDFGNPLRDTVIEIVKTVDAVIPEPDDSDSDSDEVPGGDTGDVPGNDTDIVSEDDSDEVPGGDTDEVPGGDTDEIVDPADTDEPAGPVDLNRGDCNDDGNVDNKDVVLLFRYASGPDKDNYDEKYDYNGDGKIDNKDVVSLFRAVSKK